MTGTMAAALEAEELAGTSRPRLRTPVAILVRRLPPHDQTHLLREIAELERQGQPIILIPLLNNSRDRFAQDNDWFRRHLDVPLFSSAILRSLIRIIFQRPLRFMRVMARLAFASILRPRRTWRTFTLVPKAIFIAGELERAGVKHVHAHAATYAATAAWIIGTMSGLEWSFTVHGPDIFVHRLLLHRKIAAARFVRTVSNFNKAFLSGLYPSIISEKIHVVPIGVNPDLYPISTGAKEQGQIPVILSVASLVPNKGFGFLIEACAALASEGVVLDWRIVGEGPLRAPLQEAIERYGLSSSVRLLGLLSQDDVARQMSECDIFVLPGTISLDGQMDGIPVSMIEAMAAGRPVVAPAISGIPELVTDGVTGILVDSTHPDRIVDAMRRLIADPDLRERMGAAGRELVCRSLDVRASARALVELFERHRPSVEPDSSEMTASLDLPELRGAAVAIRAIHERNDSTIAELAILDLSGRRDIVVKRHRTRPGESRPAGERARHEFDVLSMLGARLSATSTDCFVPRASSFDAAKAVVVMSRAAGEPLDSIIRKLRTRRGGETALTRSLHRTGAWLDTMQAATLQEEDGRYLLTALTVLALRDLDLASAADHQLLRSRSWILQRIRALESKVAENCPKVVGHHGDYWPGNVFIENDRVEVIDFEGYREGLALEDVAWFLVHLRFSFMFPPFHLRYPRLERSFLEGYSASRTIDLDALRLMLAAKSLVLLARGDPAARGNWKTWWMRRTLRETIFRSLS